MTAPTPPSPGSDGRQSYDPWAEHPPAGPLSPAGSAAASSAPPPTGGPNHGPHLGPDRGPASGSAAGPYEHGPSGEGGTDVRREARDAALVALGVAVLGAVLGLLWLWLAPRVPLVSDGSAVFLERPEGEEAIGADGTFVLLGLAVGAVAGAAAFLARRAGGVGIVVGLTVGGVLGAVLAWRLGVWLGPTDDLAAHARAVGEGKVFDGPLQLHAKGALLAYPFGAVLVHLLCTALFGRRDPDPHGAPPEETAT